MTRGCLGRTSCAPSGHVSCRLRHPKVGDLELQTSKLAITGTDGLILKVFHAEPGSAASANSSPYSGV